MSYPGVSPILEEPYLPLIRNVRFRPIFILGFHRSGTSLLYKLLANTHCFNFVSTYHLIRYEELLFNFLNGNQESASNALAGYFASQRITDRITPGAIIRPDFPEEYVFRFLNTRHQSRLSQRNLPIFMELCQKIQFVSDPDRPLLLKNPADFRNFRQIKLMLPNAKFIFIHRHPLHVINSQLKSIRSLLATKSTFLALLYRGYGQLFDSPMRLFIARRVASSRRQFLLRFRINHLARGTRYYLRNVGSLPEKDYISLQYEALCQDPDAQIDRILSFLQLEQGASARYGELVQPRPVHLFPEVARQADRLRRKLRPYYAHQGYD